MASSWDGIRNQLSRSSTKLEFHQSFSGIRKLHKEFAHYNDPAALLDCLRRKDISAHKKNGLLIRLVQLAKSKTIQSDTALTLMLLALWPGLDAVRRRSLWRKIGSPDEIASEVLARATDAVRSIDLDRVTHIAATILKNIERDMFRARKREDLRQREVSGIDPDELVDEHNNSEAVASSAMFLSDIVQLIGADATLVIRVALDGLTQAEVAAELGISESAARKRYQRAIRRLRDALEKIG
jgi:RNA polymerase sigma factor (sigma-70 family)